MKPIIYSAITPRGWYAAHCPDEYLKRCMRDMSYADFEKLLGIEPGSLKVFSVDLEIKVICILAFRYADAMIEME